MSLTSRCGRGTPNCIPYGSDLIPPVVSASQAGLTRDVARTDRAPPAHQANLE